MLLLKFGHWFNRFCPFKLKFVKLKSVKLPDISYAMIGVVPFLFVLAWYPSMTQLQNIHSALLKKQSLIEQKQLKAKQLILQIENSSWLDKHDWLDWHITQDLKLSEESSKKSLFTKSMLFVRFQLQGVGDYSQWQTVIDELTERYDLLPIVTDTQWLLDGRLKLTLTLQLSHVPFERPLLVVPHRLHKAWPKDMSVSTAFYWQEQWRARLHLSGKDVSLVHGLWIPELAASVVALDKRGVTFRQQSQSSKSTNRALTTNQIEYRLSYAFTSESVNGM